MKQSPDKQIKKTPSVKLSVFAAFLVFTLLTLILLWLFQVVFLEKIYKSFCIAQIQKDAEVLAGSIYSGDDLENTASEIAEEHNLCIAIMSPKEKKLTRLTDTAYKECHLYYLSLEECMTLYRYALQSEGSSLMSVSKDGKQGYVASEFTLSSSDEMHSVIYTLVCKDSSENTAVLFVNSVISPVGATTKTITALLFVISAILILFAVILSIFVSRKITKPIIDVSQKAKLFADGDYSVRFNTKNTYKEISELSATLNYAGSELSKVDNLRRELIANISHDLRTPLTLIRGYSEVMRDIPGECNPSNLQTVIDETDRLSSIVSEMLDYSKIESGNYEPQFELFNITEVLSSSVETYRLLTEKNGYTIDSEFCSDIYILGDRNMIVRALLNLINNAITHTGDNKRICVRETVNNGYIRIEVCDSGHGIPKDQLELIWERYYKADIEHKRAAIGTGLGLSIVKSIMIMHKGRFGVRSREDEGSTFWIEFALSNSPNKSNDQQNDQINDL